MKLTRIKAAVLGIASIVLLSGCTSGGSGKNSLEPEMNIGYFNNSSGFFAEELKEDLGSGNFVEYESGDKLVKDIKDGNIDVVIAPAGVAAKAQNELGELNMVNISAMNGHYLVENGDSVHNKEDLNGKKVYVLKRSEEDKAIFDIYRGSSEPIVEYFEDGNALAERLASEEGSIAFMEDPYIGKAKEKNSGLRVVEDSNEDLSISAVMAVTDKYLDSDKFTEFVKVYRELSHKAEINDERIVKGLEDKFGVSEEEAYEMMNRANWSTVDENGIKEITDEYYKRLLSKDTGAIGGEVPDKSFYCG